MSKALVDCLRYSRWANLSLIDACRGLAAEQLDARATPSSRSVRELFQHLVGSEFTFVLRTKGRQHEGESRHVEERWPGFDVIREAVGSTGDELIASATGLDEAALGALPDQGKASEYGKVLC